MLGDGSLQHGWNGAEARGLLSVCCLKTLLLQKSQNNNDGLLEKLVQSSPSIQLLCVGALPSGRVWAFPHH